MSNLILAWRNHVDDATLTASSEASVRPATNLQDENGGTYWQTVDGVDSGVTLDIDAGSAVTWRAFGAFRTNFTTAMTWTIALGTSPGASDVYSSGSVSGGIAAGYNQAIHVADQDYSARHCRITLGDGANPDTFLRVGLLYAGPIFQPGFNIAFGWSVGREDRSRMLVSRGGQKWPIDGPRPRILDFSLEFQTDAEVFDDLLELDRLQGVTGNVLAIPRPGGTYVGKEAVFGTMTMTERPRNAIHRYWSRRFTVEERL